MSIGNSAGASAAFAASRVPFEQGLYVVGPYASRVSFASQQRRSINLVTSVHNEFERAGIKDGLKSKRVAVIGAGLAGLSAAVAAASHGALVWVLEKEEKIFCQLGSAKHRDVHPTINFWPTEKIEPSTFLPFFNWYQSSSSDITTMLLKEWGTLREVFTANIKGVRLGCEVSTIKKGQTDQLKWEMSFARGTKNPPRGLEFDCVFIATGFGAERHATDCDTGSYWSLKSDKILPVTHAASELKFGRYVVSGAGDGAVIEILRLLFRGFRAGRLEENSGKMLDSPDVRQAIAEIESNARRSLVDATLHEGFPGVESQSVIEAYEQIWADYRDLVRGHIIDPDKINALLANRTTIPKVYMLGLRSTPIEYQVSPYHKLLLAIAIENGLVDYICYDGKMEVKNQVEHIIDYHASVDDGPLETLQSTLVSKLLSFKIKHTIKKRLKPSDVIVPTNPKTNWHNTFYISRHGFVSPVEGLLKKFPSKGKKRKSLAGGMAGEPRSDQVRRRQALYADHDLMTYEQADVYSTACYGVSVSNSKRWARHNLELAKEYFNKYHSVGVVDKTITKLDTTHKPPREIQVATYALDIDEPSHNPRQFNRSINLLPERFVGIQVIKQTRQVREQTSIEGHNQ